MAGCGAKCEGDGCAYHRCLAFDIFDALQAIVVLALAERGRVYVGCKVAYTSQYSLIESAAEGQVAAETHACCSDPAVAYTDERSK